MVGLQESFEGFVLRHQRTPMILPQSVAWKGLEQGSPPRPGVGL